MIPILENANRPRTTGSRSAVTKGWGRAGEELDYKETWGRLREGMMDMLLI